MNDERLQTIEQVKQFLGWSEALDFGGVSVEERYQWIQKVLVLSIIGILFLAIRAFRVYLLMYGKRPNWGEIIQNLKSG
jgi:hypothetical protein